MSEVRALVLSGGGVKGAYQVGALRHLLAEEGLDYKIVTGISVGALNSAGLGQAPFGKPAEAWGLLDKIWNDVENSKIRKNWFLFGKLAALWKPSIYDARPLMKWVQEACDPKLIRESGRMVHVGAVDFDTGNIRYVSAQDPDFHSWVYASASFPVFFQPIQIDGKSWSDGGLRDVIPIGQALKLGATHVDVIACSNPDKMEPWEAKGRKTYGHLMRSVEIMSNEVLRNDLQVTRLKNQLADLGQKYRKVEIRVVRPENKLVEDSLEFDPKAIKRMREQGYADAKAQLART